MKRLLPLALLTASAACTTVGPAYVAPTPLAGEGGWVEPAQAGAVDPAWWSAFGDPLLSRLVERALTEAPSLAEAEARLAEARASRAAVTGARLPQVSASGSAVENRISENGQFPVDRIPGFPTDFSLFDVGFDASWELDLWGRTDRAIEAAEARIGAAEAGRDAVLVSLAAEVARSYLDLRVAQAQAHTASETRDARGELARLAQLLADAGEGNALDAASAAAAYEASAAEPLRAEARAAAAAYRIAALLGEPPEAVAGELLAPAPIPAAPDAIMAGIRSDLLRRRPDIRQAERALAAATAGIGVATADLFPSFSLLGGIGVQSRSLDGLVDPGSLRLAIGPSFSWPIFSGGRIRAQIAEADARAQGAAAAYDRAVAEALADSETAINRWLAARAAEDSARAALDRQASAFALARLRQERGEDSRLALEQAHLPLIASQRALADAEGASASAAVALYKALAGGFGEGPPGQARLASPPAQP